MNNSMIYRHVNFSAICTLVMIVIWMVLNAILSGNIWDGMVISQSALKVEYCEYNNVSKLFHQSMNTYSNLAYFFFGVFILKIGINDYKNNRSFPQNELEQFPALSVLMGICLIYLCFGSAIFHASLTYLGQRVDMNGTYSISIVLLGIALYHGFFKIGFSDKIKKIWIAFLVLTIFSFIKIALLISSTMFLSIVILIQSILVFIIWFKNRKKRSIVLAISSLVLMIIAVKIRTLDVQKVGCDPHSYFQGHSIWHLLTSISTFCSYAFFRFSKS
jgi:Ceramidase